MIEQIKIKYTDGTVSNYDLSKIDEEEYFCILNEVIERLESYL